MKIISTLKLGQGLGWFATAIGSFVLPRCPSDCCVYATTMVKALNCHGTRHHIALLAIPLSEGASCVQDACFQFLRVLGEFFLFSVDC